MLPPDSLLESLLHSVPVDNVPHRAEVLGLPVLVLQVVRMLPGIDAQQRRVLAHNRVLVSIGPDLKQAGLVVLDEPRPPTALDAGERGVELGLEGGEVAVRGVDRRLRVKRSSARYPTRTSHPSQPAEDGIQRRETTYLHLARGLSTSAVLARGQVLPE